MKNPGASSNDLAMSNASLEGGLTIESVYRSRGSKKALAIAVVVIILLLIAVIALAVLYANEDSDSDSDSNANKVIATSGPVEPTTLSPKPVTTAPVKPTTLSPRPVTTASVKPTTLPTKPTNCSSTTAFPPPGPPKNQGPYNEAAVAADDVRCSEIGVDILKRNGSAVDAAIASLFCIGVINMHSAGIGGGAVMVVYIKKNKTAKYFNFREKAPGKASQDMFVNKTSESKLGGLAIAVPGEVKGMYEAHEKYGKLVWKELVEPAIKLAREGFIIHEALDTAIRKQKKHIREQEGLKELLVKEDGCLKKLGDRLVNQKLAITLERIKYEPTSFYSGSLAEDIAKDISSNQGIITEKDLKDYNVEVEPAVKASIGDLELHTTGLPSSGVLIAFMLNVLKGYNFTSQDVANEDATASAYHKIIETFRFAFARRALLGDSNNTNVSQIFSDLLNETYAENIRMSITNQTYHNVSHYGGFYSNYDAPGTSHLSVLAQNGDAVSVTSTINTHFGSKVRSTVTGITYNNEMDDFSTPGLVNVYGVEPSPSNFIKPGKRPMSSMSPIIITNATGDVVFIAGASGGTRITTGTALATMYKLWFGRNTSEAVTMPRFHNQLFPNYTAIEEKPYNLATNIVKALQSYGHYVETRNSSYCVVQAISKELDGKIYAKSDPRKGGYSYGF